MSQTHTVTVTGANIAATGDLAPSLEPRREINDLLKDEKQWALYIQALSAYFRLHDLLRLTS
jgi:hypothetical protein